MKNKDGFYTRRCKRCGELYMASSKGSRICDKCVVPISQRIKSRDNKESIYILLKNNKG